MVQKEPSLVGEFDYAFAQQLKKYYPGNRGLSQVRILGGRAWVDGKEYPRVVLEDDNTCSYYTNKEKKTGLSMEDAAKLFASDYYRELSANGGNVIAANPFDSKFFDQQHLEKEDQKIKNQRKNNRNTDKEVQSFRLLVTFMEVSGGIFIRACIVGLISLIFLMIGMSFLTAPFLVLYLALLVYGFIWSALKKIKEKKAIKLGAHGYNAKLIEDQVISELEEKRNKKKKNKKQKAKPTTANKIVAETKAVTETKTPVDKPITENNAVAENTPQTVNKSTSETKSATETKISVETKSATETSPAAQTDVKSPTSAKPPTEDTARTGELTVFKDTGDEFVTLFSFDGYKYSGWGISEMVRINSETGQVYYTAIQYDSQIASMIWQLESTEITYDEMFELAIMFAGSDAEKYENITSDNWKKLIQINQ